MTRDMAKSIAKNGSKGKTLYAVHSIRTSYDPFSGRRNVTATERFDVVSEFELETEYNNRDKYRVEFAYRDGVIEYNR